MLKNQYTLEYRLESVRLALQGDSSIVKTAQKLGINKATMYQWVAKYRSEIMTNQNDLSPEDELKQLRIENTRLQQERDILKKAAAYFALDQV